MSWLEKFDLAHCAKVFPRWKNLINNDLHFVKIYSRIGGGWKNRSPFCIDNFVASNQVIP